MNQSESFHPTQASETLEAVTAALNQIILGKDQTIRLALCCLIAKGHLLIEDIPGVGKTTLARSLATVLGLQYQRVQFTSDLLPADIIGVSVYNRNNESFKFHAGPIFSQLLLADEINRATPRTQSALLEAMEEHQVSIEGETHSLSQPFFVIATQNPTEQVGTFALPESQLDRFLMRLTMGYPDKQAERELLRGSDRRQLLAEHPPLMSAQSLLAVQVAAANVHCSDALLQYVQDLLEHSRGLQTQHGLSPRAGLSLIRAAKAWALLHGQTQVIPEHIQAVFPSVVDHRLNHLASTNNPVSQQILEQVAIP